MKYFLTIIIICSLRLASQAQTPVSSSSAFFNGDTIPYYTLPVVDIVAFLPATASDEARNYIKLRRDVIKAYPYAKIASAELSYINETVSTIKTEREKKKFIKEQENIMKAQFEKDLRNLTYTQGKILIKLINRETGNTSYELVKELRGSLQAFFWQSIARLFTANLKSQYDPQGEDKMIEQIVQSIERGELSVRN
ncbi:MAG: DUF4294 domain-containing protein [Bacteroidetes bacterium]|nr:DUF4294 domain-containing protein [Bacteroidota bacterium]